MTMIVADHVSVLRRGSKVLNGVSFVVNCGEFVGILGPNGAGKSTLLRALSGLLSSTGTIQIMGTPLAQWGHGALARARAYLPQDGQIGWPLTVWATVALGRHPHGDASTPVGRAAIERAIAAAGLAGFEGRVVDELSGGERARVLLARALATEAPIVLADEPAAQLDPRHAWAALDILRQKAKAGGAIVVALHDLTAAARICDRVLILKDGQDNGFGAPVDILTSERLHAVFGVDALIGTAEGAPYVVPLRASQ